MKFYHDALTLNVPDGVYYPREDSLLLSRAVGDTELKDKSVLEIGCGSGFLSVIMAKRKANVTAVDISNDAVKAAEENAKANAVSLTCSQSDLFSAVTGKFDLIVFNPPYLPDESGDKTYSGGKTGRETIEKFIKGAKAHLAAGGRILLLISSLTGEKEVLYLFRNTGFRTKTVARQKVPWEELVVIEASKL